MSKQRYLHIYNRSTTDIQKGILEIDGEILRFTLKPSKWYTNLSFFEKKLNVLELDPNVALEISNDKTLHPDQINFDKRYDVQTVQIDDDQLSFSLIGNIKSPKKMLITFPGISNFDNVNYRLSALTSVQNMLCTNALIVAFQDKEQIYGNYMYKTENGTNVKLLVQKVIDELLVKYNLAHCDLIFYGNSKGGTICFDYIDLYKEAKFFIDIPQIDLYNYESQNDLLRYSLGVECRQYHNYLDLIKVVKSTSVTYSFAECDFDASRGIPIKEIGGVEVCMLKDMPHTGAAMRFVIRQMTKISQEINNQQPIIRPVINTSIRIDEAKGKMFFARRLGAFKTEDDLKTLYVEIKFKYIDRPDINISLNQVFDHGVIVSWKKGFDYMKHLPSLDFTAYMVVYTKHKEYVYPLPDCIYIEKTI